jgi:hypothetical protein
MKRIEFFHMTQPLAEKLYALAYALVPDDLQAEQLVIDAYNAYLLKEKKNITKAKGPQDFSRKELPLQRRHYLKGILVYLTEIGVRRSAQLSQQLPKPHDFKNFFNLDPKTRLVVTLRYSFQFNLEEIETITSMAKYELIEKLHNGRFLLLNDLNQAAPKSTERSFFNQGMPL